MAVRDSSWVQSLVISVRQLSPQGATVVGLPVQAGSSARRRPDGLSVDGAQAADRALRLAGAGGVEVRADELARPVWPRGWFGSITTAARAAVAVVSRGGRLGVDLEPVSSGLALGRWPAAAFAAHERAGVPRDLGPEAVQLFAVQLFAVKEAVFKAIPYAAQEGLLLRHLHPRWTGRRDRVSHWEVRQPHWRAHAYSTVAAGQACAVGLLELEPGR